MANRVIEREKTILRKDPGDRIYENGQVQEGIIDSASNVDDEPARRKLAMQQKVQVREC